MRLAKRWISGVKRSFDDAGHRQPVLDNLPIAVLDALRPTLTKIALRGGRVISDRDEAMDVVVFPVSSILSVVLEMSDGDTAEVGIIGREGMSGLPIVFGISRLNQRTIVQVPDSALCMPVANFRGVVERESDLKASALLNAGRKLTHFPKGSPV